MSFRSTIFVVLLAAGGCAHRAARSGAVMPARSAVSAAMERQVRNAADAGDGDLELRALRQRVALAPEDGEARRKLAESYAAMGFAELALEHYRSGRQHAPEEFAWALGEARQWQRLQMPEQAARAVESYVEQAAAAPAEAWSWLGLLRDELGQMESGEQAHRKALKLSQEDRLHNNLGYNLLAQRRFEEAAREFEAALRKAPGNEVARNNLGIALAMRADGKNAVAHWASQSGPAAAHNNLAAVLIEQGKYAEARKELGVALGYGAGHAAALRNLKLVAELDGGEAAVQTAAPPSVWRRFGATLKRVFVGTEEVTGRGPKTAGRQVAVR